MRQFAAILLLSATFLPAFSSAGSAQQVESERLLGGNENPPVISDGSATFSAELQSDSIPFQLNYDVASGESDVRQAHLHIANPGRNGGITVFLCSNTGNTPEGATERECPPSPGEVTGDIVAGDVQQVAEAVGEPPEEIVIIEAGDLEGLARLIEQSSVYVNVHTDNHPDGEVRGQMEPRRR
jgi:CHRD domain